MPRLDRFGNRNGRDLTGVHHGASITRGQIRPFLSGSAFLRHFGFDRGAWTQFPVVTGGRQSLRILAIITTILAFGQAALGLAFRHGIIDVIPHVLGALIVAIIVAALAMSVLYRPENEQLRPAAVKLLIITGIQTLYCIGLAADIDPEVVIVVNIFHVAVASLTLVATVVAVVLILRGVPESANQ